MKANELWKLDLLEAKFTNSTPRLPYTKKLLTAKNNSKLLKKLPQSKQEALVQIEELKLDLFAKKYYNINSKLAKEIRRLSTGELKDFIAKDSKNIDNLIASRVVKCIISTILPRKDQKEHPPQYLGPEVILIITDKENVANSSKFFKDNCQNNKALNKCISNLWNNKAIKQLLVDAEWSFRVVRGNITKEEREQRQKETGKKPEIEAGDNVDDSDDENDTETEAVDYKDKKTLDESNYAVYENGSDDGEDEQHFEVDDNVNYNEVTDEEPSNSEDDDVDVDEADSEEEFLESASTTKPSYNLPQLATGYFSGGESDSEIEEDEVVKNVTQQRKNRRGQRARQKIWEQKYGKGAKHLEKERVKFQNERDQRQKEYEERVRRRAEKARIAEETAPSGSNVEPLGERKAREVGTTGLSSGLTLEVDLKLSLKVKLEAVHPSWQAKKLAEEKQKNAKFQGKKITFD